MKRASLPLRRRHFITLLGTAAAWPLAARAQQPGMPVIGLLTSRAADDVPHLLAAFREGLKQIGFVEGQNVAIEFRFADNQIGRLPALAADLVQRQVTAIAALTTSAALAAKAATTSIPIVFEGGGDPIRLGLVASLHRPGGNVTGVTQLNVVVAPKRLELLYELVPTATTMGVLIDTNDPVNGEASTGDLQAAARSLGVQLHFLSASNERDLDEAFVRLSQLRADGLVIGGGVSFFALSQKLAALALRRRLPSTKPVSSFWPVVWRATAAVLRIRTVKPAFTRAAFSEAENLASCRCSRVRSWSCS